MLVPAAMWACGADDGASPGAPDGGASSGSSSGATNASSGNLPATDGGSAAEAGLDGDAPPGADPCATLLALPAALPSAANTGVPAGITLTASGDIEADTPGMVIEAKDVTGQILVNANDVTIKNSKVHSKGGENDIAIKIKDGVKGTKVLHSEVYTETGGYVGFLGGDAFVCASYFHGWENALTVGGGMVIQASFIEKLASGQTGPHFDGIEIYGGGGPTKVVGNHIRMTDAKGEWLGETGAINLTAYQGDIDDVEMNGNTLGGGSYTLYVDEQNDSKATNVKITSNTFYKGTAAYGTHLIRREASVTVFTGNRTDDGKAVEK